MNCPHCETKLSPSLDEETGVEFHYCAECKGKAVSLSSFDESFQINSIEKLFNLAPHRLNTVPCPNCHALMNETLFDPDKTYIKLDLCGGCEYIWFDFSEFSLLKKSSESGFGEAENYYKEKAKALREQFRAESQSRLDDMKRQTEVANTFANFISGVLIGRHFK